MFIMFYDTFEKLCRAHKVAPSALTTKLGMSSSAPGRWRTGSSPDLDSVQKISDFFGVTIDYLVHGEDRHMTAHASDGSAVVQGSHGSSVSVSRHQASQDTEAKGAQDFEGELVSIYRTLELSDKLSLLQAALALKAKRE